MANRGQKRAVAAVAALIGVALLPGRQGTASELVKPVAAHRMDRGDFLAIQSQLAPQTTEPTDGTGKWLGLPMARALADPAVTRLPPWPAESHVRSAETRIVALLQDADVRSPTFRTLVAGLNTSDVVVYIESNLQIRSGFNGYLVDRVIVAGGYRYLRVVVNPELSQHQLIGVIAHELQHVMEVAEAGSVRSDQDLRTLFKSRDTGACGLAHNCTETAAAVRLQERVLAELNGRKARPADR